MISKKAIEEFKQIYKEEYDEYISGQEAVEKATRFLNLFKVIYQPMPEQLKKK
jgi:hypothetical protein